METKFTLLIVGWLAISATLVGLMIFRKYKSLDEDDFLHVSNATSSMLNSQAATAHQMNVLDRWVSVLLAAMVIYGLWIGAWLLCQAWQANSKLVS
jgi:Co/Zn/Cd efflux system component